MMKPSKPTDSSKKSPARNLSQPKATGLLDLQRVVAEAIMRPLTRTDRMQRRTGEVADGVIKPNDRLTSFERLEIYNRQYWFRLLDCLYEDYPGLLALMGDRRFLELATAYLTKYPSGSPNLRDLGERLTAFFEEELEWTEPHGTMALDMARLEWAQVVAFDGEKKPAFTAARLGKLPPERIYLRLQPYITLLEASYPVDKIVLRQGEKLRNAASNAVENAGRKRRRGIAHRVTAERTWLLVHRQDNSVYLKQLAEAEYVLLEALNRGASVAGACEMLEGHACSREVTMAQVQGWFQTWVALGFFVRA